jgi:cytochrome c oxidase assembly factor CtaG
MRPVTRLASLALALSVAAPPALAHPAGGAGQRFGWTLDPVIVAPWLLGVGLFALGWRRLAPRANLGAGRLRRRTALFAAGMLLLASALISPLHQAGGHSFTAHMAEHELLMLAVAPLLVLAEPLSVMLWAFPAGGRQTLGALSRTPAVARPWRVLTEPVTATLLQAAALWLWHAPALFDVALAHPAWHIAQHLCFVLSALFFWSAVLKRRPCNPGVAALCLFATSVVSGALGAMMAVAQSPWYAGYARLGMTPLGLTPIEDQQLAGLLMWVPGGVVHAAAALAVVAHVLRPAKREVADAVS